MLLRPPTLPGEVLTRSIPVEAVAPEAAIGTADHATLEPAGGGVITLLLESAVLVVVHFVSCRIGSDAAVTAAPSSLWLVTLIAAWFALGSWRMAHREIVNKLPWRGPFLLSRSLILATALAYLVVGVTRVRPLPSEPYLLHLLAAGLVSLFAIRGLALVAGNKMRDLANRRHRVLIIGNNARSRRILNRLQSDPSFNTEVVAMLDAEGENPARCIEADSVPYVGGLDEMESFLAEGRVDEVIVTLPLRSRYADVEQLLSACCDTGIPAHVPSDLFQVSASVGKSSSGRSGSTICYSHGQAPSFRLSVKRLVDIVGAAVGILLLGVPMLLIALTIKLTSRGPFFFRQVRSGLHGRPFVCFKFRTMVADAETRREDLEALNEMSGPVFKMANDPRVTGLGRFLRKYSLDELPQLFNVLLGDMSLVGPRPPIPEEVRSYSRTQLRRLSMRPGLTCIWQVSGRNAIQFDDWIRLDLAYIDSWSLTLDAFLLVKTLPTVLSGTGR